MEDLIEQQFIANEFFTHHVTEHDDFDHLVDCTHIYLSSTQSRAGCIGFDVDIGAPKSVIE